MPAPKANQFWKARATHGRDKIFSSHEALAEACVEYFEWVNKHPLKEQKVFHHAGHIRRATVNKMRAMTLSGLCIFLGIGRRTWNYYRDREDFSHVVESVEEIKRT